VSDVDFYRQCGGAEADVPLHIRRAQRILSRSALLRARIALALGSRAPAVLAREEILEIALASGAPPSRSGGFTARLWGAAEWVYGRRQGGQPHVE
jgi:hypothetical protein